MFSVVAQCQRDYALMLFPTTLPARGFLQYLVYMFFIVQFASCYGDIWHMRESLEAKNVTNMQPPIPFKSYLAIFRDKDIVVKRSSCVGTVSG